MGIVSLCIAPFSGQLVDKVGRRPLLIIISDTGIILAHLYFLLSPHCEEHECYLGIGGLVILGLSNSLYGSVLWPSIALVV